MTAKTKACTDCGAEFTKSPADSTVRCPDCRARRRAPKTATVKSYAPKHVAHAGRTCTVRFSTGPCGRPAVYAFESSTGEVFAECATHHV